MHDTNAPVEGLRGNIRITGTQKALQIHEDGSVTALDAGAAAMLLYLDNEIRKRAGDAKIAVSILECLKGCRAALIAGKAVDLDEWLKRTQAEMAAPEPVVRGTVQSEEAPRG